MSKEALRIAERGKDAKGKGEKERCNHLSVEFQRIARRDKKAFRSDQCKEIEENNRLGKTRPWDFPGKNAGVGCHSLLQEIFPTQGSNLGLQHCRQTLYRLSHQGSPSKVPIEESSFFSVFTFIFFHHLAFTSLYPQIKSIGILSNV